MSQKTPILEARQITYRPPGSRRILLEGLDFTVKTGKLVALIGPNGAGKSTLIRLLLGYLRPDSGEVLLEGRRIEDYKAHERAQKLAYLAQASPIESAYSVLEVVQMGRSPWLPFGRFPGKAEEQSAMEALSYLEISDLAERRFLELSGGEKQLVLFARALTQQTQVLLLDEPTASLDLGHEHRILAMLRELAAEGRSIVLAIHNLNAAAEYCDHLILLDQGRVRVSGEAREVLSNPAIEEAYGIEVSLGSSNLTGGFRLDAKPKTSKARAFHVHIIGGAGSAISLTRSLYLRGIKVSGGVAHELDSDFTLWQSLGIPSISVPAFSEIDDEAFHRALDLVNQADLVLLCGFPVGPGNRRNLDLAKAAARLLVLDDMAGSCAREFFVEGAMAAFESLEAAANLLSLEEAVRAVMALAETEQGEQRGEAQDRP